jgi:ATP-dependent RNA helicase DDX3X
LNHFLNKANYNAISIHGDKNQQKRQEAINKFKAGDIPILIATDVASRGIDFPNVSYVFNFELPTNIDDYIHRIGRTGRCGNMGNAVSFVSDKCKPIIKDLYKLLRKQNKNIPDWLEEFANRSDGCKYILI